MASITFDNFDFHQFDVLAEDTAYIMSTALYDGAEVVADTVNAYIDKIPDYCFLRKSERQDLKDGLVVSKHQKDGDSIYAYIDFAGYDDHNTANYPNGTPIRLIARAICKGVSIRPGKYDFVGRAMAECKEKAQKAMEYKMNEEISKRLNE